MKTDLTGQCLCGEISYRSDADVEFSLMCHCRQCQHITGTGHSVQFAVDASKTQVTGKVKSYKLTSDRGNEVISTFCGTCGNPIYKSTQAMPGKYFFHAGTLDDPSLIQPGVSVHTETAQPWDHIHAEKKT